MWHYPHVHLAWIANLLSKRFLKLFFFNNIVAKFISLSQKSPEANKLFITSQFYSIQEIVHCQLEKIFYFLSCAVFSLMNKYWDCRKLLPSGSAALFPSPLCSSYCIQYRFISWSRGPWTVTTQHSLRSIIGNINYISRDGRVRRGLFMLLLLSSAATWALMAY